MSKTATLPQGKVQYLDRGEGEPIVFVHGFLVDSRLWRGVADALEGDFRCITPDWPMGSQRIALEPGADLSPPGVAELIVAFLDELGIERATIVGNDSGGAMSQILAANYPSRVERLALTARQDRDEPVRRRRRAGPGRLPARFAGRRAGVLRKPGRGCARAQD